MSPTVVGDAVLVGSCRGSVYALDRTNGHLIWQYNTATDGDTAQFHGDPLIIHERAVVATDADPQGYVYSFEISSGRPHWKLPFPGGVATNPLLIESHVIVASTQGEIAAIKEATGRVVWRVSPSGTLEVTPFVLSPAVGHHHIFFADNQGSICSIDAGSGKIAWKTALSDRPNTSVAVIGNNVIVGTIDGFLNWVDADSGTVRQQVFLDGYPYGTLVVLPTAALVLVNGETAKLLALDSLNGKVRWSQETRKEWTTYRPLIAGSVIIVGNEEEGLCAINQADGSVRWRRSVEGVPRGLGISPDGILYMGSLTGTVQAFQLTKADVD